MSCEYQHLLSPYYDRELPDERMREVESHLASCESCSRRLAALAVASRSFRSLESPPALGAERTGSRRAARALPSLAAALAILAIGLVLYLARGPGRLEMEASGSGLASVAAVATGLQGFECDWLAAESECQLVSPCLSAADCGPQGEIGVPPTSDELAPPHHE